MICKKCKTAVLESEIKCPNCGAPINKGLTAKKTMGLVIIISIVAVCGLYIYFQPNLFNDNQEIPVASETPRPEQSENVNPTEVITPVPTADLNKGLDDVYEMLGKVYTAAEEYYYQATQFKPFVSKKGFLYDLVAKRLVTTQDLIDSDLLDKKYEGENIFIMYFAPSALEPYDEVRFFYSTDLAIFVGYETKDGIALVTGEERGVLYREHYNSLVEIYAFEHGEIRRPDSSSAEYKNILNTVISYDFITEDVYVRYMAADDKYAVLVLSKDSAPNKPEGFILENIEGEYTVVFNNFEEYSRFQADVNNAITDINIDLLPKYTLYYENEKIKKEYPFLVIKLKSDGVLADTDKLIFSSGNDNYAYMVFESGLIILGYSKTGSTVWEYSEVTNWLDAELKLEEMEPVEPPTYIIWQQ